MVVCPVDPYVDQDYFEALKELGRLAETGDANLVLMGVEPTYPSEKYGYIIPADKEKVSRVDTFKEKPDAKTAEEYIRQGALWNGGVFAYKLKYVLQRAHELIDFTDYEDLFSKYEGLTKISFDYAVVEKEKDIQVMRFSDNGRIWVPGIRLRRLWRTPAWARRSSMKTVRMCMWSMNWMCRCSAWSERRGGVRQSGGNPGIG